MTTTTEDPLAEAREVVARHEWDRGFELFQDADASVELGPEDLEIMAEAAWWAMHPDEAIEALERAYAGYVEAKDNARAAFVALTLSREHGAKLAGSEATGWFNRAKRLLASEPEGPEHGFLYGRQSVRALNAGNLDEAIELARRGAEIGERLGDPDLRAASLMYQGMALVEKGELADGMALIDEASLAAVSGELGPYVTGSVYCNMIGTCCELADYGRAGEWTEAALRRGVRITPGDCRVHQAEVLVLRGQWAEAEESARRGAEELRAFNRFVHVGEGMYQIGEIRRLMGDVAGAQAAYHDAGELGRDPQPGLSLLLLQQGKVDAATASITRALEEETASKLSRARLLPSFVRISLEAGKFDAAAEATDELEEIAGTFDAPARHAAAHVARGAVLLVKGDPKEAARTLRRAVTLWHDVEAPYEAARARVLLARAIREQGDEETSAMELRAARATFEKLGAVPDRNAADDLLAGAAAATGSVGTERGVKTFLFTDIVRSTDLVEAIGDEAWVDVVRWHDETLRSLFATHGGDEVDHAGDGFFVAFDEAGRALECAVAIQRTLADHRRAHGFAPTVRIGVHATAATRLGRTFRGKGVHEAARIASLAEGGEIIASRDTVTSSARSIPVVDAREVRLKGISDPVQVVAIDWRKGSTS
ncbi:MAG: adenylate/guanylate cyclase domain-containing protein [Actinobacteria bacterium]|nr:adenylate/guanylate cyclase domain-containing protein [Actinomycetota bacterium]